MKKTLPWLFAGLLLGLLFSFASCGGAKCVGCVDLSGTCQSSSNATCGINGATCVACQTGQSCSAGVCVGNATGGGAGGGAGGGSGGGTGGGSSSGHGLGQSCTTAANNCDNGLACFGSAGATEGLCSADCSSAACVSGTCVNVGAMLCAITCTTSNDCPSGDVCATLSGSTSICTPDCRISSGQCGTGTACNSAVGYCTQTGAGQAGDACGQTIGACTAGLQCLVPMGASSGFCSKSCTQNSDCPTSPAGATCALTAGTSMYCGWICSAASTDAGVGCPPQLTCKAAGSGFLCQ